MTLLRFFSVLLLLATGGLASAQTSFVGTWQVDLAATGSYDVQRYRVDDSTVQRVATTTVGRGAKGMGTLKINPDGTYELRYLEYELIYKTPVIRGSWAPVPQGEIFADLGAIALEGAKPDPKYPPAERKWYVFQKEDGSVEARYPPYDGYAKIRLTGGTARPGARPARPTAPAAGQVVPAAPAAAAAAAQPRVWTPDQVRRELEGKTEAEVYALLGRPVKVAYGTHSFNGVEKVFPPCHNGCNWKSFAIQFGGPGGTANSIELQSWLVE